MELCVPSTIWLRISELQVQSYSGKTIPVQHQLIVKGARDLGGGKYSFDVFEPWTGITRTVSGGPIEIPLHYWCWKERRRIELRTAAG